MYYSQFLEDKLIEKYLKDNDIKIVPKFFEIGAAEITRNSNSRFFIESMDFEAYLFEPNSEFFAKLVDHYKANNKVKVENIAISNKDGQVKFDFQEDYTLSGISENGSSTIEAKKLSTYLNQNGLDKNIGIVSIDTEGYDTPILQDILADQILPDIIIIEANNGKDSKLQHSILEDKYKRIYATGRGSWASKNIFLKIFRTIFKLIKIQPPLRPVNTVWLRKDLVK